MFERNQLIPCHTINPVTYANHYGSMLNYDVQSFLIENKEAILSFLQNVERPRFPDQMAREQNSMSRSPSPITRARSGSRSKSLSRSPRDRRYSRSRSASPRRSRSRSRSRSDSRSPRRYSSSKYSPKRRYRSRSRSPRDYRRSDYGKSSRRFGDGREKPKPCRCIGIFGMSLDTSEKNLQKLFEKYGKIENIKIIRDHYSGRSRGYGFIYFEDIRDAEDAKQAMTDVVIDGAKVRVDFSVTDGPSRSKRARSRSPIHRRSRSRS